MKVAPSSGDVFRELGFSAGESEHLLVRADLLLQLQKVLAARELTQVQASRLLHVTQPRIRDLLRGRIDLFSTDSLIDMLALLGVPVRVVPKRAPSRRSVAKARPAIRRIDYSDIPDASAQQLKAMRRRERARLVTNPAD